MSKVCLINPPLNMHLRLWYPIGIGYVARALHDAGHDVEVIDCIGENLSKQQFLERIRSLVHIDVFGVGGLIMAFNHVCWITKTLRTRFPNSLIVAGNTVGSTVPELLLEHSAVDGIVMWEGERTMVNVVNTMSVDVPGMYGQSARPPLPQFNKRPFWEALPMQNYYNNNGGVHPLSMVRGCPYRCTFCLHLFMGYKPRCRSADSLLQELVEAYNQFHIREFVLLDDLSIMFQHTMKEFCRKKQQHPQLQKLRWRCSGRVNLLDDAMVSMMADAGCYAIGLGFESANQEVLDYYHKNQTVDQMIQAIQICNTYNVDVATNGSFMIGCPIESEQSIRESSLFAQKYGLRFVPHIVTPFPGTSLYQYAEDHQLITNQYQYVQRLAKQGHTNTVVVNLTSMTDDVLMGLKQKYMVVPKKTIHTYIQKLPVLWHTVKHQGVGSAVTKIHQFTKPVACTHQWWNEWQ